MKQRTVIAFTAGCSYRRVLEDWLSMSAVVPDRILELASYHAIVACVAAGSGIAIMPRAVLQAVHAQDEVTSYDLPARFARARTYLVRRSGHQSVALDALRTELRKLKKAKRNKS